VIQFEDEVAKLLAAGKTKGEAIRQVARQFPDLHEGFVSRAQAPGFKADFRPIPSGNFEKMVNLAMGNGKTRGEAIRHVVKLHPDLHQSFINRANRA